MTGQRVGYVRVSTLDQNTVRQLADVDRAFEDKASGKDSERPGVILKDCAPGHSSIRTIVSLTPPTARHQIQTL